MVNLPTSDAIVDALEDVEEHMRLLCLHIYDDLKKFPLWIDNGAGELVADKDRCIYALKHFKPTEALSPQETFACTGAIGGTQATLQLIENVNRAKDAFRHSIDNYLKHYTSGKRDTTVIRDILTANQYPGIKLLQVYRHIKYITYHPRRISFNQSSHSSNRIITRKEAEQLLLEIGQGEHIDIQLAKASLLGKNDKLVIRRNLRDCGLVNIATFKSEVGRSTFEKVWTSIPLFFVYDKLLPLPQVTFSRKYEKHKQGPRADKKTENQPFIESLRAYRYKLGKNS
jgi:hypothetical protein